MLFARFPLQGGDRDFTMTNLFEVDESVERALHKERLSGRVDLNKDIFRGNHAKTVIAELNHAKQLRDFGQHTWGRDDFEFRPEMKPLHGAGFHAVGLLHGYDRWDDDDYIKHIQRKNPELRANLKSSKCMIVVGSKYGPPKL